MEDMTQSCEIRGWNVKVIGWIILPTVSDSIHAGVSETLFYVGSWNRGSIYCKRAAYK